MSKLASTIQKHEQGQNITEEAIVDNLFCARILAAAARSAAMAHDELFVLKHNIAVEAEPERARLSLEIQGLREELDIARATIEEMGRQHEQNELKLRGDHFEKRCNDLLNSTSWRVTAPLRALSRFFRGY